MIDQRLLHNSIAYELQKAAERVESEAERETKLNKFKESFLSNALTPKSANQQIEGLHLPTEHHLDQIQ